MNFDKVVIKDKVYPYSVIQENIELSYTTGGPLKIRSAMILCNAI